MHCAFHCSRCASHFKTLSAFDAHLERVSPDDASTGCLDTYEVEVLTSATEDGTCRLGNAECVEGITIWTTRIADADNAPMADIAFADEAAAS